MPTNQLVVEGKNMDMKKMQKELLLEIISKEENKRDGIEKTGKRETEPNILNISNAVDEYYFLQKIELYCAYLSYRGILGKGAVAYNEEDVRMVPYILKEFELIPPKNTLLRIYHKLIPLLRDGSDYRNIHEDDVLKSLDIDLSDACETLHKEDLFGVLTILFNYCAKKMNEGCDTYGIRYFEYASMDVNMKFGEDDSQEEMPVGLYQNMIKIMLRESKVLLSSVSVSRVIPKDSLKWASPQEWCRSFMECYTTKIRDDRQRMISYDYCNILILFSEERYEEAYNAISMKISLYKGILLSLTFRVLYLQILYEIYNNNQNFFLGSKWNLITNEIDNYRKKLVDDKKGKSINLGYHTPYFQDFLFIIRKLYSATRDKKTIWRKDVGKVVEELTDFVSDKNHSYVDWVDEKLQELKK